MKNKVVFICATMVMAATTHAYDLGGSDWNFNFSGNYTIANLNSGNESLVSGLLGSSLNLTSQLNLISGTTVAHNEPVTVTQSSLAHFSTSSLTTTATPGSGLVSGLGAFVANALNLSNGSYAGTVSGTNVTMNHAIGTTLNLNGLVDTRVLGTGVVLDLEAVVPSSTYNGVITGVDSGSSSPFGGGRVNTITGTAGNLNTITLEADVLTYVSGFNTTSTGYVDLGVINNKATSWSMSRPPQSTPCPSSAITLVIGLAGLALKRRASLA
jgi:hypothetical protein